MAPAVREPGPTNMTTTNVLNFLDEAIKDVALKKGIKLSYRLEDRTEPFEADHSSPIVRSLVLGVIDIRGKRPMLIKKTGTGDMNILGNACNIPVVTYGPGNPHSSHTAEENVSEGITVLLYRVVLPPLLVLATTLLLRRLQQPSTQQGLKHRCKKN